MFKKTKAMARRLFFKYCPPSLLTRVLRNMISINYNYDPDLVVKIAETKEELEGAFQVLYRSYLEMGYCGKSESEMRLTIHHALPTTSVIIAKYRNEVVGTLTLVRDNRLDLPCEKEWNIDALKAGGKRVAEITSLAIDKRFRRGESGNIFFPILKFMYEFSTKYFGTQVLTIVIHPKEKSFYEGLFLFKPINQKVVNDYYGAPAIGLYLDLAEAKHTYKMAYAHKPKQKNIFYFYEHFQSKNLIMPVKNSYSVDYPVLDKHLFHYFFFLKSNIGRTVSENILQKILLHYPSRQVYRDSSRFTVDIHAKLMDPSTSYQQEVVIKNISTSGLRISTEEPVIPSDPQREFSIQFNYMNRVFEMKIISQWNKDGTQGGFRVQSNQLNWFRFLKSINGNYAKSEDVREVFRKPQFKLQA